MIPGRVALGAGLVVLGAGSAMAVLVIALISTFVSLGRLDAPGSQVLLLEPGRYSLFWETPARSAPHRPAAPDIPIEVVSVDLGEPVTVATQGHWTTRYSTGFREGVSIARFSILRKAPYRATAGPPTATPDAKGVLSLTKSPSRTDVLKVVLGALALLGAGGGPGVLLLMKRR